MELATIGFSDISYLSELIPHLFNIHVFYLKSMNK